MQTNLSEGIIAGYRLEMTDIVPYDMDNPPGWKVGKDAPKDLCVKKYLPVDKGKFCVQITLITPKGKKLFNRDSFHMQYPCGWSYEQIVLSAFGWFCVDTDSFADDDEYWEDYTKAELRWRDSFACEQLQYEIMVAEEKYNA